MKRWFSMVAGVIALIGVAAFAGFGSIAFAQDATPEAVESEASPTPEPIRVITLVAWYQTSTAGDVIEVGPLNTNDQLIAGPGNPASGLTGTVDLLNPDLDVQARITLGDSVFDGVEAFEGDPDSVFRWTYPGGEPGDRPATLVVEVVATAGPYEGYTGMATFASRSTPGSGVLVIMINPPDES